MLRDFRRRWRAEPGARGTCLRWARHPLPSGTSSLSACAERSSARVAITMFRSTAVVGACRILNFADVRVAAIEGIGELLVNDARDRRLRRNTACNLVRCRAPQVLRRSCAPRPSARKFCSHSGAGSGSTAPSRAGFRNLIRLPASLERTSFRFAIADDASHDQIADYRKPRRMRAPANNRVPRPRASSSACAGRSGSERLQAWRIRKERAHPGESCVTSGCTSV